MGFIVEKVSDEKGLRDVYKLRYKVYCREWGFENPDKYPDGIETDVFDKYSDHFALKDSAGKLAGSIRLILNSPEGFPIERYCQINENKNELERKSLSEISRLVISKEYRSRAEDRYIYGPDEERRSIGSFHNTGAVYRRRSHDRYRQGALEGKSAMQDRRQKHEAAECLFKAIYQHSKRKRITHWYAVMTKGLYILLSRLGIAFQAVGDLVDYHGIRTPYLGDIEKIEQEVSIKNQELYMDFTREI